MRIRNASKKKLSKTAADILTLLSSAASTRLSYTRDEIRAHRAWSMYYVKRFQRQNHNMFFRHLHSTSFSSSSLFFFPYILSRLRAGSLAAIYESIQRLSAT